jgi:hypothetical protein
MAIRQTRKISELNTLTSASLNTYVLGVDNGATYKITLDVLEDAVVNMVSRSTDLRLDALESYTSSANAATDISALNSFTSSQTTLNSAFTSGINARLQTSSFNEFSASVHTEILAATNEQDLSAYVTQLVVNTLSSSVDSRIDNLEANSGSYLTSLNGAISSSSQLTSSYDSRYVISGSITQTTWDNIANKPSGIVSQSTDLSSLNTFTQSIDNRVDSLESWSSSLDSTFATDLQVSIVSSSVAATIGVISQNTGLVSTSSFNSYTASISTASLVTSINNLNTYTASQSTSSLVNRLNAIESVSGSWITESETGSFLTNLNGAISSSSQLTSSFDTRYTISGSVGATPLGTISGSAQITAYGFISSSDSTTALNSYTASLKNAIELTGSTVSFLGNIVIYGTQSVINSQNVEISDNILYLSPTASTDNDLGIVGHYNDGTYKHAGIFMDASDGHSWKVFNGLQTETTATVDTSGTGFTLADFKAGVITGTSFNGIVNATNGVISGSSQLPAGLVSGSSQVLGGSGVVSGSYETTGRSIISSSAQITALGFVSSSTTINTGSFVTTSSFNAFTASALTTGSNTFSGSQIISGGLYVTSITSISSSFSLPSGSSLLILSGSNIYVDSSGSITGSLSGSIFGIGDVVAFSSSVNSRLNNAGGVAGTISGSSQLTSSFDTRYTLSGSVSAVPSGTISGSAQITAFGFVSSSSSIPAGTISGSAQITTFGFVSGSYETTGRNIFSGSSQITGVLAPSNLSTTGQVSASVFVGGYLVPEAKFTVVSSKAMTFWPNTAYEAVRFTTANNVIIGGFGSVVDYGFRLDVSGSMRVWGNTTITGSILGLSGITGSIAATNGVISGSSQLTSSYDSRYVLETETGSLQTSITSLNTLTSSLATTGSNSFNGAQNITGSLTVSSVAVISSSFTANSSSLTLNSGSNFYLQNNGIAEITGSLVVSGSVNIISTTALQIGTGSGDEGGEILLAKSQTNNSLTGSGITIDSFQNKLRIFEQGGNARGVYVDLSKAPGGVGGELLWKASGLVNTGVDVTLGNLKARLASSGNYSLQVSTIVGTYSVYGSSVYSYNGIGGVTLSSPLTITTTPTYISAGYNFLVAGSTDTWIITDTSAGISWRISLMIGPSFTNNMITIERLV